MKLRKNSGKILWGLFFILAAVYVVVSKLWIMPEISVFSVLLTVFFIWLFLNGIRNVNFWEILFSIAFICIIYDDWLGITALTPVSYTHLGFPADRLEKIQAAFSDFKKEALQRKKAVKTGTASPKEFTDWLYQQSNVIVELTEI